MSGSRRLHPVRRATRRDVGAMGRMLARAFDDDPFAAWAWPPERRPSDILERFYGWRARSLVDAGEVWMTEEMTAAAVWAPPGRWQLGLRWSLAALPLVPSLRGRLRAVREGLELLDRAHPREQHMYLAVLGTDPAHRGTGAGSAVMEPALSTCDARLLPAYLESSKERNIAFYERHGFEVLQELSLPDGPPVWPMRRPSPAPREASAQAAE